VTGPAAPDRPLVLAFDTGSPITSVAVAGAGAVLAQEVVERAASSDSLVALIDAVLRRVGGHADAVGAICALRGPGSFTGLRIGLATALGLHQALGVRVAAMPTLRVLVEAAEGRAARVAAIVDALRDEWFVQIFERHGAVEERGPARILAADAVRELDVDAVVGFGARRLLGRSEGDGALAIEPPALAALAARLATDWASWDPALITEPLYLRAAPTTPKPGRSRGPLRQERDETTD
jgi:tRNA threonylcarbamoyladenosine biosynthesis protein TsaB